MRFGHSERTGLIDAGAARGVIERVASKGAACEDVRIQRLRDILLKRNGGARRGEERQEVLRSSPWRIRLEAKVEGRNRSGSTSVRNVRNHGVERVAQSEGTKIAHVTQTRLQLAMRVERSARMEVVAAERCTVEHQSVAE